MLGAMLLHQPSQVWSMNWNRPVAEEVLDWALGLRLDFPHRGAQQIMEIRSGRGGGILQRGDDAVCARGLAMRLLPASSSLNGRAGNGSLLSLPVAPVSAPLWLTIAYRAALS